MGQSLTEGERLKEETLEVHLSQVTLLPLCHVLKMPTTSLLFRSALGTSSL